MLKGLIGGTRGVAAAVLAAAAMLVPGVSAATGQTGLVTRINFERPDWGRSRAGQYLAGIQAQRLNDPASAAKYLEGALGHDPNNMGLVRHVFYLMVSEGQLDSASQHGRMILRHEPGSFIPVMALAVDAMRGGNYTEALNLFGNLESGGHNGLMKTLGQAWAAVGIGDLAAARAVLDFPVSAPGWDDIRPIHRALVEDIGGGNAQPLYDELKTQPNGITRRLREFIDNFEARQTKPDTPPLVTNPAAGLALAFSTIGSALVQAQQERTALVYIRLGLALSPSDVSLLLLLADALQSKDRYQEAAAAYDAIPVNSEFYYLAQIARARNLAADGETKDGIIELEKLTARFADAAEAPMQLGDLLRQDKRYAEATAAYDTAFSRLAAAGKNPDWQLFYTRGITHERTGAWNKAEADLKQALALKKEQPLVLNYLGYSWIDRGENLEEATAMVRKAAELRPDDGFIADSVGWAAYRLGNMEEAVQELERAILIEPLDPTINEHLGDIYWLVGRKIEARFQWERAMAFDPEAERIPGLKERLACTETVCAPLAKESSKLAQ